MTYYREAVNTIIGEVMFETLHEKHVHRTESGERTSCVSNNRIYTALTRAILLMADGETHYFPICWLLGWWLRSGGG